MQRQKGAGQGRGGSVPWRLVLRLLVLRPLHLGSRVFVSVSPYSSADVPAPAGGRGSGCAEVRAPGGAKGARHRYPPAGDRSPAGISHLSSFTQVRSSARIRAPRSPPRLSSQVSFCRRCPHPQVSPRPDMVDVLGGRRLVTCDGAWVEAEAALQNKVVALYFAAGRCAPSRDFTPLLCDFYEELVDEARPPAPFEVVFVSADGSAQEMLEFMKELHGAWLALPFHDPYRQ